MEKMLCLLTNFYVRLEILKFFLLKYVWWNILLKKFKYITKVVKKDTDIYKVKC